MTEWPSAPTVSKGKHTLSVRAKDLAGNIDAIPVTWKVTVR